MNRSSDNISRINYQAFLNSEYTASGPKSVGRVEASDLAHLQWQVWKGYLLMGIIFGAFILAPLNVTGPLKARVSQIISHPISIIR